MAESSLFYLIFLSQVFLISFYFPRKMLNRITHVFQTYPPSEYPKLYPEPMEYYERVQRNYRNMNVLIFLAGLLLMVGLLDYSRGYKWNGNIVMIYYMIQVFPMCLVEIGARKYYKSMKEIHSSTTRKAELRPRRLFDFISPLTIGLVVLVYGAFIVFIHYVRQFEYPWFGGYLNIVGITVSNLFLAGIVFWNLYGKKRDPYQTYEDRKKQIKLVAKQMAAVSIVATLYITMEIVLASLDLRHLQPMSKSIYFQLITMICFRTLQIENMNFEVYKEVLNDKENVMAHTRGMA